MKSCIGRVLALGLAISMLGCTAKVEPTEDSTRVEVEVPKLEIGEQPADLDPATDEDVDIDTPAPGDT